jgi:hypothetical protein
MIADKITVRNSQVCIGVPLIKKTILMLSSRKPSDARVVLNGDIASA